MKPFILVPALGGIVALACSLPAHALTLAPSDQGNISEVDSRLGVPPSVLTLNPDDTNVSVASLSTVGGSVTRRGYVWFDIPDAVTDASAVTLKVDVVALGAGSISFNLVSVEHGFDDFQVALSGPPTTAGTDLIFDLSNGDSYLAPVTLDASTSLIGASFALSASAVAAVNAAHGGRFAIGFTGLGSLASLEFIHPVLEVTTAVPEPSSWLLGSIGLLAAVVRWRRVAVRG
jgi:hypothetical protein